jgi:hypothetical protein
MIETAIAQLRCSASLVFGIPFDLRSLDRLVDALGETRREFGSLGPEDAGPLGEPALDEGDPTLPRPTQLRWRVWADLVEIDVHQLLATQTGRERDVNDGSIAQRPSG